jgi:hypothetical protein
MPSLAQWANSNIHSFIFGEMPDQRIANLKKGPQRHKGHQGKKPQKMEKYRCPNAGTDWLALVLFFMAFVPLW